MRNTKPTWRHHLRSMARLFSPRRRQPDAELDSFILQVERDIWEDYDRNPEGEIERYLGSQADIVAPRRARR